MTARDYELALSDACMQAMGSGVWDLEGLAAKLNAAGVRPLHGAAWDAAALHAEMRRIGNKPPKKAWAGPVRVRREVPPETHGAVREPAAADFAQVLERQLELGVRNQWYCVAGSREVQDRPFAVTALGEKLVLWRDEAGTVRATEDRCPHRGIALSIGSVREGRLKCAYHGVEVDRNGVVVDVPAFPGCPWSGKKMIRDYPVLEHYEGIWAYFGDARHPDPPPFQLPPELTEPEWSGWPYIETWKGHYQYVYDNVCDPMHGSYLHGTIPSHAGGKRTDYIKVQDTGRGFEVFREGQQGLAFDWMEFVDEGGCQYMRIKIPFPKSAGPGGHLQIIFFVTPVDAHHTRIFAWRLRKVSGWEDDLWHFLYRTRLGIIMATVLGQDRDALAAMPAWPPQENLYQHDLGLVRARRHMRQLAEAQARALCGPA